MKHTFSDTFAFEITNQAVTMTCEAKEISAPIGTDAAISIETVLLAISRSDEIPETVFLRQSQPVIAQRELLVACVVLGPDWTAYIHSLDRGDRVLLDLVTESATYRSFIPFSKGDTRFVELLSLL